MPVSAGPATIVTDCKLYSRPSTQSSKIMHLSAGTRVHTRLRSGGWKKIEVDPARSGWVRGYQVRAGEISPNTDTANSGGFLTGLASLSRRVSSLFSNGPDRRNTYNTATIGVRGLSEEQIRNARPDFAELGRMERFRSNDQLARGFARQGGIRARTVNHLPPSSREQ